MPAQPTATSPLAAPLPTDRATPTQRATVTPAATVTQPVEDQPSTSTPSPVEPTAQPSPTSPYATLDADIARQMDEIEQQVISLRGLQPTGLVQRALLTSDELRQNVVTDFLGNYSRDDARQDANILATFGLLEPGYDLYNLFIELYSEQVAGYYDNESKEMFVVQGTGFHGPERLTYAHEYTHVLQDQAYDIQNGLGYSEDACETDTERCAAIAALIEGDATLTELQWFSSYGTQQDMDELLAFYQSYTSPVFDSAPDFMQDDFLFPYQVGQVFVQYLHDRDGWAAVDAAYNDLPASTEQILHPERYPNDQPVVVTLPDLSLDLGNNWQELERGVMGEWYTYLILAKGADEAARLSDRQSKDAAEGWGGDAYVIYTNDQTGQEIMVLTTEWDSPDDANEFAEAFLSYADGRFGERIQNSPDFESWQGDDNYHEFRRVGERTYWILAPDAATALAVWEQLQP